jgi:tetratricopeptide (TPR) repeat protein
MGPDAAYWLARLDQNVDNLRAILARDTLDQDRAEAALRLSGSLFWFWYLAGYWNEGGTWLETALDRYPPAARTALRAKALFGAAGLRWLRGSSATARAQVEESISLWQELGDRRGLAYAVILAGLIGLSQGDFAVAIGKLQGGLAFALDSMGGAAEYQANYARARELLEESLALSRELGAQWGTAYALASLGRVALGQGRFAEADELCAESLARARALRMKRLMARPLHTLGSVAQGQGKPAEAMAYFGESLALYQEVGDRLGIPEAIEGLAGVYGALGEAERAARLFGAAEALREAGGVPLPPSGWATYELLVTAARAQTAAATWATAWASGRSLSAEQAIAEALRDQP